MAGGSKAPAPHSGPQPPRVLAVTLGTVPSLLGEACPGVLRAPAIPHALRPGRAQPRPMHHAPGPQAALGTNVHLADTAREAPSQSTGTGRHRDPSSRTRRPGPRRDSVAWTDPCRRSAAALSTHVAGQGHSAQGRAPLQSRAPAAALQVPPRPPGVTGDGRWRPGVGSWQTRGTRSRQAVSEP